jgi:hypothetical protein
MPYVHIKTLESRKSVCLVCPRYVEKNKSCGIDNQGINMKFFLNNCPLNKWPIEEFKETHKAPRKQKTKDPSLVRKIKSFSRSIYRWARSGFSKASEKQINKRLEICRGCEFWDSEAWGGTGKCKKCGCSTYAKIRLKTEKCPIGKW